MKQRMLALLVASGVLTSSVAYALPQSLGIAAHYCDKVAVMRAGRVIEINETCAFFVAPVHPYSKQLLGSIRF
jgi:peptide/nickel transport system ATP-binding protein